MKAKSRIRKLTRRFRRNAVWLKDVTVTYVKTVPHSIKRGWLWLHGVRFSGPWCTEKWGTGHGCFKRPYHQDDCRCSCGKPFYGEDNTSAWIADLRKNLPEPAIPENVPAVKPLFARLLEEVTANG